MNNYPNFLIISGPFVKEIIYRFKRPRFGHFMDIFYYFLGCLFMGWISWVDEEFYNGTEVEQDL